MNQPEAVNVIRQYNWQDVPTLKDMYYSNVRHQFCMGPFGCLAGDTKVITEKGLLPISDITEPMRVLSWNEITNQFELSSSTGAFPKGKDYLYRVTTPKGMFEAAAHHRVLCADNTYQPVSSLRCGQTLLLYSGCHFLKSVLEPPLLSPLSGLHYWKTVANLTAHYVKSIRQYGQQLLLGANIFQVSVPLLADVQTLSLFSYFCENEHMGGHGEQTLKHNHLSQFSDQIQIDDFYHRSERQDPILEGYNCELSVLHIEGIIRQFWKSLQKYVSHRKEQLFSQYSHSCSSSLSEWSIISIEKLPVKNIFWDMHVFGNNNYVTADGTIHHNSGKSSAMIAKILRYASEQTPSPDGIKRSRWAIVRNFYPQLKDTTIKTVKFWLPEEIPGNVWKEVEHNYYVQCFPGIQLELMFRALDRPEHVSNLLSMEITAAWLNEFREISKDIFEAIDGRIGRYPSRQEGGCKWYGILGDSNPPSDRSYWYKLFEKTKPPGLKVWKQPSGLSPKAENLPNLPKNYYKNLCHGKEMSYIDVYIHGKYGYLKEGKPVFEMYNDNYHVANMVLDPHQDIPVVMGWDFALHPTCVLGQMLRGQVTVLDLVMGEDMGVERMIDNLLLPLIQTRYRGCKFIGLGDPTGIVRSPTDESTCYQILHNRGFVDVKPAPTNSLVVRLGAVNHFLGRNVGGGTPALLLSPHLSILRQALAGGYCYKTVPGKNDEWTDEPLKNYYSHPADALQALCLFYTEKTINREKDIRLQAMLKKRMYMPADLIAGY